MLKTIPKVIIVEGSNPLDVLIGQGERGSLEQVCRLFGHHVFSVFVRDKTEFKQTLNYIGSISRHPDVGSDPLFIHVSVHGDTEGIIVGPNELTWNDLGKMIVQMYTDLDSYEGPVIFILSACGASQQKLTNLLKIKYHDSKVKSPPQYVFVFTDEDVLWTDAVVAWTIFYSQIESIDFSSSKHDIAKVKNILRRLYDSTLAKLTYYRWDSKKMIYRTYDPQRERRAK